ncbi:hypothetical protein [Deinococcus sp. Leaf326]|uniref:hypothetical protein n=1 Tax=Deinococcus sp. Leaf326 TaxID=1736338 RepID=UPI0006F498A2|nr:hypothetical protein [Deinococcus sp. Leaf326]KQR33144.1 hypothetical protein ASF71_16775 [Deinococcus sp. Leaf326]
MNTPPPAASLICGYCGVARGADALCTCSAQQRVYDCRRLERAGVLQAQRQGVAAISTWGAVPRGHILTAIRSTS